MNHGRTRIEREWVDIDPRSDVEFLLNTPGLRTPRWNGAMRRQRRIGLWEGIGLSAITVVATVVCWLILHHVYG